MLQTTIASFLALPLVLSSLVSNTVEYTAEPVYASNSPEIEASETIEQKIDRIALEHKISRTTLFNLAMSESSLGVLRVGDEGKSCGIIHFHKDYYPEEFSRCDDDEYILNRASEMIANDEEWKFTPCNCYAYAEVKTSYKLPKMIDIVPNDTIPKVGGLVILRYKNEKHIGVIFEITKEGLWIDEANFSPCKLDKRLIEWGDSHLKGYWNPPETR